MLQGNSASSLENLLAYCRQIDKMKIGSKQIHLVRGFIKFLCRRSVGFYSRAFLVFLMKESKKRRLKQPGKLMA